MKKEEGKKSLTKEKKTKGWKFASFIITNFAFYSIIMMIVKVTVEACTVINNDMSTKINSTIVMIYPSILIGMICLVFFVYQLLNMYIFNKETKISTYVTISVVSVMLIIASLLLVFFL